MESVTHVTPVTRPVTVTSVTEGKKRMKRDSLCNTVTLWGYDTMLPRYDVTHVTSVTPVTDVTSQNDLMMISESWSKEIYELDEFFEAVALPVAPVRLNAWTVITDPVKFVASHMEIVKANRRNRTFEPFLQRLLELKTVLLHRGDKDLNHVFNSKEQFQLNRETTQVTEQHYG